MPSFSRGHSRTEPPTLPPFIIGHAPTLATLSVLFGITGVFALLLSLYFVVTGLDRSASVPVTAVAGAGMAACGYLSFHAVRALAATRALLALSAAAAWECVAAALLLGLRLPFSAHICGLVGGVHGAGIAVALLGICWLAYTQARLRIKQAEEQLFVRKLQADVYSKRAQALGGDDVTNTAAHVIAKAIMYARKPYRVLFLTYRVFVRASLFMCLHMCRTLRERMLGQRSGEIRSWSQLNTARSLLRSSCYFLLVLVGAFTAYINIIYGVTFKPEENVEWVTSVCIGFVYGTYL